MRILIISQYFWPENFIINQLAITLKKQGNEVIVATGKPNYPDGEIYSGYKGWGISREYFDKDIEVFRVPTYPRSKGGTLSLIINYLVFVISGVFLFPFLLRNKKFDSILVFAGSPNAAIPAIFIKWVKRCHLTLWIQDLWPDTLFSTGHIKNKYIISSIKKLVKWTYKHADTLLVQSHAFINPIIKLSKTSKVFYYPNVADVSIKQGDAEVVISDDFINVLDSYFTVVFTGNIGTAQSMQTLIGAAQILKTEKNIKFVLVGSGSMLEWVKEQQLKLKLDNIYISGRYPISSMDFIFKNSGCLLAMLKSDEIFTYTIPGKIQAYLSSGKPIIASLNGEGARIIVESGSGITCPAEDSAALASSVLKLFKISETERTLMGKSGKKYYNEHFEINKQAKKLVEILESRIIKKNINFKK
jgi:glycosyltransferase involved in cell wall biosynthesis